MEEDQDFSHTQVAAPGTGNGQTPRPGVDIVPAALWQELAQQTLDLQNLLPINGEFGPISPAQFMTLSGNACKLYLYCSIGAWVGIPLQQDLLPFGVGLQDIRTVLRALNELWQHQCIQVAFDQTVVETPEDLQVQGKRIVLKTESDVLPLNWIYVHCVGFPDHLPEAVAASLHGKLQRQIAYHQQRVRDLQAVNAWWDERLREQ
jgi:hypothetical protein